MQRYEVSRVISDYLYLHCIARTWIHTENILGKSRKSEVWPF